MRYDRLRILLVDDNHHTCMLIGEVLRAVGVREIHEAHDGHEALKALREHEIDIVLTDLVMPRMDGFEFVRSLRASAENPNRLAPVIVVSGHSTVNAVREARDAGANEFLAKPITARAVLDHVHEVVEHARPFVKSADYFGPDRRRRHDPEFGGPWRRADDAARAAASAQDEAQQKAAEDEA